VLDGIDVLSGATRAEHAVGGAVIRLSRAAVWTCAVFLAVAFILVGISKLEGP